ncbi:MAG: antitoxin [Candidatus Omnitrophica bacterium]|nr:antitoxin [Candidatus Omnitrophota bacterium]
MLKRIRLTKEEREIEAAIGRGEYVPVSPEKEKAISAAIERWRKKDAVLNIRINSEDLTNLKKKAAKLGVRYQTFISQILRNVANS